MTISPAIDSDDNPPKEVIITNEKSLTEHGYSKMKSTAEQDMKLMISAATERSKEEIGKAINNAKSIAIQDINAEYDAIVADLKKFDTTKDELEIETNIAIQSMQDAKLTGNEIQDKMNSVIAGHKKVEQDIVISRASITQAHERKRELDTLIAATTTKVANLEKDTKSYEVAIATATATAKDKAIGDATTYLSSHNDTLLDKMEKVFSCNMQLMEDEKDEFNVDKAAHDAIEKFLTPATTTKMITQVSESNALLNSADNIIRALVKRQRKMEETFQNKMDRDFKERTTFYEATMTTMMQDMQEKVDNLSAQISGQMDTLDERQLRLVKENNKLYNQSGDLKDTISKLRVEIDSTTSNLQTQNVQPAGLEPVQNSSITGTKSDDAPAKHIFMAKHPIDTTGGDKTKF